MPTYAAENGGHPVVCSPRLVQRWPVGRPRSCIGRRVLLHAHVAILWSGRALPQGLSASAAVALALTGDVASAAAGLSSFVLGCALAMHACGGLSAHSIALHQRSPTRRSSRGQVHLGLLHLQRRAVCCLLLAVGH
jgi:hypothetical protein